MEHGKFTQVKEQELRLPSFGDTKIIDGVLYRYVDTGYTLREYYAHTTEGKGPGPGWDTVESLLDEERAIARFGRTFTQDEVFNFKGKSLPDVPFGKWERVEGV
jgi:hypothetical protein